MADRERRHSGSSSESGSSHRRSSRGGSNRSGSSGSSGEKSHIGSRHRSSSSSNSSSRGNTRSGRIVTGSSSTGSHGDTHSSSRSHRSSSRKHSKSSESPRFNSVSRYAIATALLLVVGLIVLLSLSGKKNDNNSLPFQDMLSFESTEMTLGARLFSFVNDKEYAFVVTSAELPESEDFTLTRPAPFSIQDAVACASETLPAYVEVEDFPNWFISSVSLRHCTASKWYYVVDYKKRNATVSFDGTANQVHIPVQFDGKIPEGVERFSTKKRERAFKMAVESLGVTPVELLQREKEREEVSLRCDDLSFLSDVGSQVLKFELSSDLLERSDTVDVTGNLPLSPSGAVQIAMNASRLYIPLGERSGWRITEVSLKRWGLSEKWYYVVAFKMKDTVGLPVEKQLLIPVLMNGETVKGERIATSL